MAISGLINNDFKKRDYFKLKREKERNYNSLYSKSSLLIRFQ